MMDEKQSLGFTDFQRQHGGTEGHRMVKRFSSGGKRKIQKEFSGAMLDRDVAFRQKRTSEGEDYGLDDETDYTQQGPSLSSMGGMLMKNMKQDGRSDVNRVYNPPRHWTEEEDLRLREAVEVYGEKQWKQIAEHVPGRNHTQCLQRWSKVLSPGLKKGLWSNEEDNLLLSLAADELEACRRAGKPPKIHWGQVKKGIPGRTAKQCRERWVNNLNPAINRGHWSNEEDSLLLRLYDEMPKKWAAIAKHLNNRTENAVKIRHKHLTKEGGHSSEQTADMDTVPPKIDSLLLGIPQPSLYAATDTSMRYDQMVPPNSAPQYTPSLAYDQSYAIYQQGQDLHRNTSTGANANRGDMGYANHGAYGQALPTTQTSRQAYRGNEHYAGFDDSSPYRQYTYEDPASFRADGPLTTSESLSASLRNLLIQDNTMGPISSASSLKKNSIQTKRPSLLDSKNNQGSIGSWKHMASQDPEIWANNNCSISDSIRNIFSTDSANPSSQKDAYVISELM